MSWYVCKLEGTSVGICVSKTTHVKSSVDLIQFAIKHFLQLDAFWRGAHGILSVVVQSNFVVRSFHVFRQIELSLNAIRLDFPGFGTLCVVELSYDQLKKDRDQKNQKEREQRHVCVCDHVDVVQSAQLHPYQTCWLLHLKLDPATKMSKSELGVLVSSVANVSDFVFKKAKTEKQSSGTVSDETLKALHFIHGPPFLSALDLIDRHGVNHVITSSGKNVYQVKSSAGYNHYVCHLSPNATCSCPSFSYGAVAREDALFCKHLLAVKMSEVLGCTKQETMSDEMFKQLFESVDKSSE